MKQFVNEVTYAKANLSQVTSKISLGPAHIINIRSFPFDSVLYYNREVLDS